MANSDDSTQLDCSTELLEFQGSRPYSTRVHPSRNEDPGAGDNFFHRQIKSRSEFATRLVYASVPGYRSNIFTSTSLLVLPWTSFWQRKGEKSRKGSFRDVHWLTSLLSTAMSSTAEGIFSSGGGPGGGGTEPLGDLRLRNVSAATEKASNNKMREPRLSIHTDADNHFVHGICQRAASKVLAFCLASCLVAAQAADNNVNVAPTTSDQVRNSLLPLINPASSLFVCVCVCVVSIDPTGPKMTRVNSFSLRSHLDPHVPPANRRAVPRLWRRRRKSNCRRGGTSPRRQPRDGRGPPPRDRRWRLPQSFPVAGHMRRGRGWPGCIRGRRAFGRQRRPGNRRWLRAFGGGAVAGVVAGATRRRRVTGGFVKCKVCSKTGAREGGGVQGRTTAVSCRHHVCTG